MTDKTEKPQTDSELIQEAKARFEKAKTFNSTARALAIADTKFALGDSDNGWQWPSEISTSRTADRKCMLTVNATAQHCNQITNAIRQNPPDVKVSPVDSFADKKTAEILGGLIRNIHSESSADHIHCLAADHSVMGGEGYWRIITEYESDESFDQVIKIKACPNPQLILIDPDAKEPDKSDAMWGFVFEDIPEEQCKREHPDIDPQSWVSEAKKSGWAGDKTVRRAEYFWCEFKKDTLYLFQDGSTILKSKIPAGSRMPEGTDIVKQREVDVKQWYWCKLLGGHDAPLDKTPWPGAYLPIISVVGKEINVDGEIVRKGIVRDLKDSARMLNYAYSETVQTLALQNKIPYLAPAEAISGFEEIWKGANLDNRAYLPYNAFDDEGNTIPRPERQQPAVMPAAQVQLLQLSTEQMRAASGQQNANFGIRSEAQSGIGIQRLKVQGEVATFHFPDNLALSCKYEGKVLLDLIQKVYDTARVVRILGLDGKEEHAHLNPEMQSAYHEEDINGQVQKIFNPTVGKYDVTIDTGPSYATQRQEAFNSLSDIASRNPQLMGVCGDLIMKAADFPMADQMAERLYKTLPTNLQDDKGQQAPSPEVQQQMQQMEQGLQQMQQALQQAHQQLDQLHQEKQAKVIEAQSRIAVAHEDAEVKREDAERRYQVEVYKAETERLTALGGAVTPEQVQALVIQTIQQVMTAPPLEQELYEQQEEAYQEPPEYTQQGYPEQGYPEQYQQQPPNGGFFTPEGLQQ